MEQNKPEVVKCQMMIRKPIAEVFEAFIDPKHTVNFWFTKSSGKLETGKTIQWNWEMYNHSLEILVKEINTNKKISIVWGTPITSVDFNFEAMDAQQTYVTILHYGIDKKGDELIEAVKDSTGGFTIVLDGLKAYLEHGINLRLIEDKYPKTN